MIGATESFQRQGTASMGLGTLPMTSTCSGCACGVAIGDNGDTEIYLQ